jgi:hypothetical protein
LGKYLRIFTVPSGNGFVKTYTNFGLVYLKGVLTDQLHLLSEGAKHLHIEVTGGGHDFQKITLKAYSKE